MLAKTDRTPLDSFYYYFTIKLLLFYKWKSIIWLIFMMISYLSLKIPKAVWNRLYFSGSFRFEASLIEKKLVNNNRITSYQTFFISL